MILLIILLIVLGLVACVLFCPFSYRIRAGFSDSVSVQAEIFDFLHFFHLLFCRQNKENSLSVKLFWDLLTVYPRSKKKKNKKKKHSSEKKSKKQTASKNDQPKSRAEEKRQEEKTQKEKRQEETKPEEKSPEKKETSDHISDRRKQNQKKKKSKKQKRRGKKKQKNRKSGVSAFLESLKDPKNRRTYRFLFDKVLGLLRHLMPTIEQADLSYSAGEPDLTGEITGVLSWLPFVYGKKKHFRPDFTSDEPYLRGEITLHGRISVIIILIVVIQILINKDARKLIFSFF